MEVFRNLIHFIFNLARNNIIYISTQYRVKYLAIKNGQDEVPIANFRDIEVCDVEEI